VCHSKLQKKIGSLLNLMWVSPFIADVIVHRLLATALDIVKLLSVFKEGPQLTGIADSKSLRDQMHY
jgi:hypothetical protein